MPKKKHTIVYNAKNEAVSHSANVQSGEKLKPKSDLKEPFQADKDSQSFVEDESDDESEEEWNYTMTITWEQDDEDLKTAYI